MKFNKSFLIRIVSSEHCKAVQERLFQLGYSWGPGIGRVPYKLEARTLCLGQQQEITWAPGGFKSSSTVYEEITLTDLYSERFVGISQVEVKLNDSYTALVTKDKITVDCQTFDTEVVHKLHEALIKLNA